MLVSMMPMWKGYVTTITRLDGVSTAPIPWVQDVTIPVFMAPSQLPLTSHVTVIPVTMTKHARSCAAAMETVATILVYVKRDIREITVENLTVQVRKLSFKIFFYVRNFTDSSKLCSYV